MSSLPFSPIPPSVGVLVEKGQGILRGHSEAPRTVGDFGKLQILSKFPVPSWGVRLSFYPGICTIEKSFPPVPFKDSCFAFSRAWLSHVENKEFLVDNDTYTCP